MIVWCILLKNCSGRIGILNICRAHEEIILIKSDFCPKQNMSKNARFFLPSFRVKLDAICARMNHIIFM
jgi:hypothetical protein